MFPNTSPTLFDTLATTAGKPKAIRMGKVISEPEPTTALIPPAATPAAKIASASAGCNGHLHTPDRKEARARSAQRARPGRPPQVPVLDDQRQPEALGQVPLGEHVLHPARGQDGPLP